MPVFDQEAYRRRLKLLRMLFDESQTDFAERRLKIGFKKWNHYERGYPIPRETAWLIRDKVPGINEGWIWFGEETSIPDHLLQRLRDLEAKLREKERKARPLMETADRAIRRIRKPATVIPLPKRKSRK